MENEKKRYHKKISILAFSKLSNLQGWYKEQAFATFETLGETVLPETKLYKLDGFEASVVYDKSDCNNRHFLLVRANFVITLCHLFDLFTLVHQIVRRKLRQILTFQHSASIQLFTLKCRYEVSYSRKKLSFFSF